MCRRRDRIAQLVQVLARTRERVLHRLLGLGAVAEQVIGDGVRLSRRRFRQLGQHARAQFLGAGRDWQRVAGQEEGASRKHCTGKEPRAERAVDIGPRVRRFRRADRGSS